MQKPGIKTIAVASIIIIIILIISTRGCGKSGGKELVYEKVTRGAVKKTISATGELAILESVIIFSKINGIIEKVNVAVDQKVTKGQLLMNIDSSPIRQRLLKEESLLENAKLGITSAERDFDGKKDLFKDNLISKRALEMSEVEYKSALNRYKLAKIDYDITVKEMNDSKVYSPINGIVITVNVYPSLQVGVSAQLAQLATSLNKMLLTINVDESDIGYIKGGQQVFFSVSAYPDKKFKGTISQVLINPVKAAGLVSYQALVICDNSELLLRPGMTATATVVVEEKKDVLMVLSQAFIVSPEDDVNANETKKIVWKKTGIIDGKPYKKIEVKTGLQGDMYTEVLEGLKENDDVLVRIKEKK